MAFFEAGLSTLGKLAGLAGLGSTVGGIVSSIGAGKRDLKRRKELAKYENDLAMQNYATQLRDQRQLIQEERDYNDYSSVIKRALKAGVNPIHAVGGSSSIGVQSSAGSTPSASSGSVSSSGVDPSSTLISAGSTLSAQSRQMALLDAEVKRAEAEARMAEIEAHWKDRDLSSIILNREEQTKLYSAGIKEKQAQTRWYTLDSDLKEQEKEFKESMNPMYLDQMQSTLRQQELMIDKVQFENDTQREAFRAKMKESAAYVDNVYSIIDERLKNIELRSQELGLSREQLDEVRAKRQQVERHFQRTQEFHEKQDSKRLDHQIAQGYLGEANKLLSTCADVVTSPIIGSLITSQMY